MDISSDPRFNFEANPTMDELIAQQGKGPITNPTIPLGDFWPPKSGPERCHELKGNRKGAFSVDLKQPYRLLFRPLEAEAPADRSNEQHRWQSITSIDIFAIEDTHE